MKRILILFFIMVGVNYLNAQQMKPEETEVWEPEPVVVTPGNGAEAPSDAIILFNGKDIDNWVNRKGESAQWDVSDGILTVAKGKGVISTKEVFGDCQLHIEWRTPAEVKGDGQGRGNSGIFLQGIYELQVLDSYDNRTYSNGQAGSIYKQTMPLVNACKPPGEWQSYDIIYKAPTFNADGSLNTPAYITVLQNGILIQNNTEIKGDTPHIGLPKYVSHGEGPLTLQDHGNPTSFRNIWMRKL
jgi:hypothetical protein